MDDQQREFENFLRGFQPVQPAALPQVQILRAKRLWVSRSAAGATLTLAATIALCLVAMQRTSDRGDREPIHRQALSGVVLTRLAVENPERFNSLVDQKRFPRFDRSSSALHSLARE
jgi:hypothetical protein